MTLQNEDILKPVRERLIEEGQKQLVEVPPSLESDFKKQGTLLGAINGAAKGAVLGGVAGTAGAALGGFVGTAIPEIGFAAAVPAAVVVGIMGYFGAKAGPKIGKDK